MGKMDPARHEGKRREILDAAGRCFSRDGLQRASISAICTEARMSPGHLYHYFDSKEAIVEGLAAAYLAGIRENFRPLEGAGAVSKILSELRKAVAASATGEHVLFFELLAESTRNPKISSAVQSNTDLQRDIFIELITHGQETGEIKNGLNAASTASVLIALLDCAKLMRTRDANLDVEKSSDALASLVENLLSTSE